MIVTNGIAPQTTSAVMTAKPLQGFTNQSWCVKFPKWSFVSVQFATPNSESTIQRQMSTATTTGVAHTNTRPAVNRIRTNECSRTSRSAIAVPSTIVSETLTAVNRIVRRTTCQNWLSWKILE